MKFSIIYTDVDNVEKPAAVERKDRRGKKWTTERKMSKERRNKGGRSRKL